LAVRPTSAAERVAGQLEYQEEIDQKANMARRLCRDVKLFDINYLLACCRVKGREMTSGLHQPSRQILDDNLGMKSNI
jgi:hypothetical protein